MTKTICEICDKSNQGNYSYIDGVGWVCRYCLKVLATTDSPNGPAIITHGKGPGAAGSRDISFLRPNPLLETKRAAQKLELSGAMKRNPALARNMRMKIDGLERREAIGEHSKIGYDTSKSQHPLQKGVSKELKKQWRGIIADG